MTTKPLQVFGIRVYKVSGWTTILTQPRLIVAAPSRAAAVRAIQVHSPDFRDAHMARRGAVTYNPGEVETAMSAPGTVFLEVDHVHSQPIGPKFIALVTEKENTDA